MARYDLPYPTRGHCMDKDPTLRERRQRTNNRELNEERELTIDA
jgi:hypothetical protein